MIEHFSKWIELAPLWDKCNEGVAYALLDLIMNIFGLLVEVLMDQGMEIWKEL
jgi:hypothetical protein